MKLAFLLLFISIFQLANAQSKPLPPWFLQAFKANKLDSKYQLETKLKPNYLEADFNSDGYNDVAAIVKEKGSNKTGILLILGKTKKFQIFGAGNMLGKPGFDDSDDLKWIAGWEVYKSHTAYETKFDNGDIVGTIKRHLRNKAISIWSEEDGEPLAGGLITWDGVKYIWIHQGE